MALLLALRLPFLPATLEDIDSVNFDLGVHQYDPVHHQPHPPGYPVYIAIARVAHAWFQSHAAGLAFVSAVFSALSVVPLYLMLARLLSRREAVLACILTLLNPIVWFNSVRPMSDLTGFCLVTATQWILLSAVAEDRPARRTRLWIVGTLLAGFSVGTRLQAVWLVAPLLLYGLWRLRSIWIGAVTFLCGSAAVALWAIPLLVTTGGAGSLLDAFDSMVRNSLPVEPLVTGFSLQRAAAAAVDVVVAPWRLGPGFVIMLLALIGAVKLIRRDRRALVVLTVLFLPYAMYHYALQSTPVLRYAIPVVPLAASLASVAVLRGTRHRYVFPLAAAAAVIVSAVATLPALAAYHRTASPPFQALAHIGTLQAPRGSVVVTGHHMFERYLAQVSGHDVLLPHQGARQTLITYWNEGNRKPVLFLRQPVRNTLLLFGYEPPERLGRWRWPRPVRPFMRGERPGRVELVRLEAPRWFSESGFLITDEVGPLEAVARQQPRLRVRASMRRRPLVVSGFLRNTDAAEISVMHGARGTSRWKVGHQFALRTWLDPTPERVGYLPVTLEASTDAVFTDVWVDRGDRPFIRPSHGFYLPERDAEAELFRWVAPHAIATAYLPAPAGRVTVEGWIPEEYYRLPVELSLEWNGRPLGSLAISTANFRGEWLVSGTPHEPWGELAISMSQSFVPHEVQRNGDRRTLGARIYTLALAPAVPELR